VRESERRGADCFEGRTKDEQLRRARDDGERGEGKEDIKLKSGHYSSASLHRFANEKKISAVRSALSYVPG
jgi:hypothetical protein